MQGSFTYKYITVSALNAFIRSDEYNQFEFYPISKLRALSHANNPRASADDIALILAFNKGKLVAYLGTLPDQVFNNGLYQKIAWYSCLYVHPDYRRSGLAMKIVDLAYEKYNGFICISNYHPPSKAAFLKTGKYHEVKVLEGTRAYLQMNTRELLVGKIPGFKKIKPILAVVDKTINSITHRYFKNRSSQKHSDISFLPLDVTKTSTNRFIRELTSASPFNRDGDDFSWIIKYPWVTNKKSASFHPEKYFFSLTSPDFKQYALQINNSKGEIIGMVFLTIHRNLMKIPYLIIPEEYMPDTYQYIYNIMLQKKIATLVTFHQPFCKFLRNHKQDFILQRSAEFGYMATAKVMDFLNGNFKQPFEGDGDGVFS